MKKKVSVLEIRNPFPGDNMVLQNSPSLRFQMAQTFRHLSMPVARPPMWGVEETPDGAQGSCRGLRAHCSERGVLRGELAPRRCRSHSRVLPTALQFQGGDSRVLNPSK